MALQIEINQKFKQALTLMEKGTPGPLFITGKAGTGKSTLLDYWRNLTKKAVVVLAPTGVAAVNVNGETIHSFFNFKPETVPEDARRIAQRERKRRAKLFSALEAIVIDEISMVRADLLDCVDVFLQTILKNPSPFGGKQMIFFGDLYQLPPVTQNKDRKIFQTVYASPYFFDAQVMKRCQLQLIELDKIYRQKDDFFINILNGLRTNTITEKDLKIINQRVREDINPYTQEKGVVYLTTTNKLAEQINRARLEKLPGKSCFFEAAIEGRFEEKFLPTSKILELKKGAQIILLNNDGQGRWINGTLGEIIGFSGKGIKVKLDNNSEVLVKPHRWEIFETFFDNKKKTLAKKVLGAFIQFPLKLAWALTIHKSQGKTFDKVIIDLSGGTFAGGQTYVALSRCRTLEGIILKKPLKKSNVFTDWRIAKYLTSYQYALSEERLPKQEKIMLIKKAIREKAKLKIIYLRTNDQKSERVILPLQLGQMEYQGKKYLGLRAFCFLRNEERNFRLERMLAIETVN